MSNTYKIMIVEDDPTIAGAVKAHLESWGFTSFVPDDFSRVDALVRREAPHLILMDIGLPFYNGLHWCGEIRKFSNVPVIFLSSNRDNMNIVMAMNMGGDDFVTKPFDLMVLTAKIQALLRRAYDFSSSSEALEVNGVVLDLPTASLLYDGQRIDLTKNEFRILQVLMENAGRIVSRDALMERLWETDSFVDDNTLTVNVNRLRKKLEDWGIREFIATRKGMGYSAG